MQVSNMDFSSGKDVTLSRQTLPRINTFFAESGNSKMLPFAFLPQNFFNGLTVGRLVNEIFDGWCVESLEERSIYKKFSMI